MLPVIIGTEPPTWPWPIYLDLKWHPIQICVETEMTYIMTAFDTECTKGLSQCKTFLLQHRSVLDYNSVLEKWVRGQWGRWSTHCPLAIFYYVCRNEDSSGLICIPSMWPAHRGKTDTFKSILSQPFSSHSKKQFDCNETE